MTLPKNKILTAQILFTLLYMGFWPILYLIIAGDWYWIEAWVYEVYFFAMTLSVMVYLYFKDQALLAERFRMLGSGNQKPWDIFFFIVFATLILAWIAIIPLDVKRFQWSTEFPLFLKILGGLFLIGASFFLYRSFSDNTFLSPYVRISKERKQKVVQTGVYAFVRHPMYLGGTLCFFGTPLFLGSYYGLIVGLILTIILAVRLIGEEKMLVDELEGYKEYKQKVKYRLIPYVW